LAYGRFRPILGTASRNGRWATPSTSWASPTRASPRSRSPARVAPSWLPSKKEAGFVCQRLGRLADARVRYEAALGASELDPSVALNLARLAMEAEDRPEADRWIARLTEALPGHPLPSELTATRDAWLASGRTPRFVPRFEVASPVARFLCDGRGADVPTARPKGALCAA